MKILCKSFACFINLFTHLNTLPCRNCFLRSTSLFSKVYAYFLICNYLLLVLEHEKHFSRKKSTHKKLSSVLILLLCFLVLRSFVFLPFPRLFHSQQSPERSTKQKKQKNIIKFSIFFPLNRLSNTHRRKFWWLGTADS